MLAGFLIGTFLTLGLIFAGTGYVTFLLLKWGHRHPARLMSILARLSGLLGITADAGRSDQERVS